MMKLIQSGVLLGFMILIGGMSMAQGAEISNRGALKKSMKQGLMPSKNLKMLCATKPSEFTTNSLKRALKLIQIHEKVQTRGYVSLDKEYYALIQPMSQSINLKVTTTFLGQVVSKEGPLKLCEDQAGKLFLSALGKEGQFIVGKNGFTIRNMKTKEDWSFESGLTPSHLRESSSATVAVRGKGLKSSASN